jgi:hypothetical protein
MTKTAHTPHPFDKMSKTPPQKPHFFAPKSPHGQKKWPKLIVEKIHFVRISPPKPLKTPLNPFKNLLQLSFVCKLTEFSIKMSIRTCAEKEKKSPIKSIDLTKS